MTTNNTLYNTFSETFVTKLNNFKQGNEEYEKSQSLEDRFYKFKTSFECSFVINLHELDKSGLFEMSINMPLHQDVKELFVNLLNSQGFRLVKPEEIKKVNDYYIHNDNNEHNKTYFCVCKYIPKYHKKAE